jgi:hypothetical protein
MASTPVRIVATFSPRRFLGDSDDRRACGRPVDPGVDQPFFTSRSRQLLARVAAGVALPHPGGREARVP